MSQFFTNPENPRARKQLKGDFDYKMILERRWIELGIPLYYARVATIDHKDMWIPCMKNGMPAEQAADFLANDIRRSYKLEGAAA